MTDTGKLLQPQAEWQRARTGLTWPEKIRMAEAVRESIVKFRYARSSPTVGVAGSRDAASEAPGPPPDE